MPEQETPKRMRIAASRQKLPVRLKACQKADVTSGRSRDRVVRPFSHRWGYGRTQNVVEVAGLIHDGERCLKHVKPVQR